MQASTRRRLVFGAALTAAASTLSCGSGETAVPTAAPAARAPAAGPASGSTASLPGEGTASAETGALPKALPADVPSYPGARVVTNSSAPEQGLLIAFQSKDSPEKVFEFYRQKLAEQGWNVEGEMSSADQRILIAGKGDRKASVLVSASEAGETQITLTLTNEEG
ncbi:MAG TPA: hypothetical protein VKM54_14430 [Myxococcota bacterium]|nr:hypothetical protein [Myxococcota bacterium]